MDLREVFARRVAVGLKRQSVTSPSRWAEQYRVMSKGPWGFTRYPWLRDMHDCEAEMIIGMKGAQLGFTEYCLNMAFYAMDIKGTSVLYLMPSKTPDAAEFSTSRFDVALELSPHLQSMFVDVKNVSMKRAGKATMYLRGTQSKAGMRGLPIGLLILDERSAMNQENVPLALQRVKGQEAFQVIQISTPTYADENIDAEYKNSSQGHFNFRCPGCGEFLVLEFPRNLRITAESPLDPGILNSHLFCHLCQSVLKHEEKSIWLAQNEWVHDYPDRLTKGFHINQLYSPTVKPSTIATEFLLAQSDLVREQEFFNGDLGLTHEVSGARINQEELEACRSDQRNSDLPRRSERLTTMGIDVGAWCHFEISEWIFGKDFDPDQLESATCRTLRQGKVRTFAELEKLIELFRPHSFVIDANPETRLSKNLCLRYFGIGKMCYYGRGIKDKTISEDQNDDEPKITVHRTSWMDLALGRYRNRTITIPLDTNLEYFDHLKAPVRIPERDSDGNPTARYDNGTKQDHHAHSRTYCEIAMALAVSKGTSQNLGKIL